MNAPWPADPIGLCPTCLLLVGDPDFEGCCSDKCLTELYAYMADLEDVHDHISEWVQL